MKEILSRDEVLEGYYKLENIEKLFGSDILILPIIKPVNKQDEGRFYNQPLSTDMKREYPEIDAKCYCKSQNSIPVFITNQVPQDLELGYYVILTIAGMTTILDFMMRHYKNEKIDINLYLKLENDNFLNVPYEGKASGLNKKINEILIEKKINSYQPITNGPVSGDPDLIRKYKQLCDDGIITQEEFQAKKKEILGL
jgi:hypothetical protein